MSLNELRGSFEIQVGEKKFTCLINMNAFRLLTENEGIGLNDFDKEMKDNPLGFIPRVLYWGAVNYLERGGKTRKALPNFSTWAAHTCEDDQRLAKYAEKIVASMTGPVTKKEDETPGN